MHLGMLAAAHLTLVAALAGTGPALAAAASPAAEQSAAIVVTPTTGTKRLVEPGQAGVNVVAFDVTAAKGATLTGIAAKTQDGDAVDCGDGPATLTGDAKRHCEYALPGLRTGEQKKFTVTVTATSDGKNEQRTLDVDVAATPVDVHLFLNGEERADAVLGETSGGLPVAAGAPIAATLVIKNPGSARLDIAAEGWACPAKALAGGESVTCTREVTAPTATGERRVVDAAVDLKDAEGRSGQVRRHGAAVVVEEAALAQTGLPVLPTLLTGFGMILGGAGLRRWSRRG